MSRNFARDIPISLALQLYSAFPVRCAVCGLIRGLGVPTKGELLFVHSQVLVLMAVISSRFRVSCGWRRVLLGSMREGGR